MASSQAACINLFLPLLQYPDAAACILQTVNPDLAAIDVESLNSGYQLEFWGKSYISNPGGFLNDHNDASGTDADIAIAYRDHAGRLNLWLIEHKLSEPEFTACGAATSKGRTRQHYCDSSADVYRDPNLCYYHSGRSFQYWPITKDARALFPAEKFTEKQPCPFMGGLNQLWRNQLLAYAIENQETPFKKVYFSVIHHPGNIYLDHSIHQFKQMLNTSDRFFTFTSKDIVKAAQPQPELAGWVQWYQNLYLWKREWQE